MASALSTRVPASAAGARTAVKARAADRPVWFPGELGGWGRAREWREGGDTGAALLLLLGDALPRRRPRPLSTRSFFLSLSPPGAVPPAHLAAADLPGNRGFDPMCLGADPKALAW